MADKRELFVEDNISGMWSVSYFRTCFNDKIKRHLSDNKFIKRQSWINGQ